MNRCYGRYEDKICACCGSIIPNAHHKTVYCKQCKSEYMGSKQKEQQAEYKARQRAKNAMANPPKPKEKTTDSFCEGCIYFDSYRVCNYYLITDIRRPCPPGKGCTVRAKKRKVKK